MTKIAICAGEPSGDEHSVGVVAALRALDPGCVIRGMGLRHLREAGIELVVDASQGAAVMGFSEALAGARAVGAAFRSMTRLLADWTPDLLIIVNFSDFNLRLAKEAKRRRVPVLFFIPPQVWAWRGSRVRKINERVDAAALIFPFEREFYERRGCKKAVYVGHPFSDVFPPKIMPAEARRAWLAAHGLDPARPVALLFAGSRKNELKHHLGLTLEAAALVGRAHPDVQFVLNAASPEDKTVMEEAARGSPVKVLCEDAFTLMQCGTAGLVKSGTSNLQAAFAGLPFSMYFRGSALTAFIVRRFVHIKEYSIVNILRPHSVREFIQEQVAPRALADELEALLYDETRRQALKQSFAEITALLGTHDEHPAFAGARSAGERTARLALSLVNKKPTEKGIIQQ